MLDVHVVSSAEERERPAYVECLRSLEIAQVRAHHVEAVPGNLGAARVQGFAMGEAPWVAFCDPDDVLVPEGVDAMRAALHRHTDAVAIYCNERITRDGSTSLRFERAATTPRSKFRQMHGLVAYRREVVRQVAGHMAGATMHPMIYPRIEALTSGPVIGLDAVGYEWRVREGSSRTRTDGVQPARDWIELGLRALR